MVIDVCSKYGWIIPLEDKSRQSIINAFKKIINNDKRIHKFIWAEKGQDFYNTTFIDLLDKNNIKLYLLKMSKHLVLLNAGLEQ